MTSNTEEEMMHKESMLQSKIAIIAVAFICLTILISSFSVCIAQPTVIKKSLVFSGIINGEQVDYTGLVLVDSTLHAVSEIYQAARATIKHLTKQTRG
jgi:hypothetical protein